MTSLLKSSIRPLVLLSLMAGVGLPSFAQTATEQTTGHRGMVHESDPAKRQEMMAERQAELKAQLLLTAAQEPAWNTFIASRMQPADRAALRAEMETLPQAQRRDRMMTLRAQREADVGAFYAVLSADQKKVFDEQRKHKDHAYGHGRGPSRG